MVAVFVLYPLSEWIFVNRVIVLLKKLCRDFLWLVFDFISSLVAKTYRLLCHVGDIKLSPLYGILCLLLMDLWFVVRPWRP